MTNLLRSSMFAAALCLVVGGAKGQSDFPNRPIKIVAPFPPGSSDLVARKLGESVGKALGQPVIIENKPGAQGVVAARAVAKASSDGYTLLLGTNSTHGANPYMVKDLGYDPIKSFTPIAQLTVNPLVLVVNAKLPVRTVTEFVKYAKQRPGQMSYGTGNSGSLVAAQLLKAQAGIDAVAVAYPGVAQATTDLAGGRLDFMVTDPMVVKSFAETGKLRILGLTSRQTLASFPEAIPLADSGLPGYEYASWIGLFGPAGLPSEVTRRLNTAFNKALSDPEAAKFLAGIGMIAGNSTSDTFGSFVQIQLRIWGRLMKDAEVRSL